MTLYLTKKGRRALFAHLFKAGRKRLGLTQTEMSKKLRCTQSRLCKIEQGRLEPGAGDLWWLADHVAGVRLIEHFEAVLPKELL